MSTEATTGEQKFNFSLALIMLFFCSGPVLPCAMIMAYLIFGLPGARFVLIIGCLWALLISVWFGGIITGIITPETQHYVYYDVINPIIKPVLDWFENWLRNH